MAPCLIRSQGSLRRSCDTPKSCQDFNSNAAKPYWQTKTVNGAIKVEQPFISVGKRRNEEYHQAQWKGRKEI